MDQIIKEFSDISLVAATRAQPHILPADLEADNDNVMDRAEVWGGVLEYYREQQEYNMNRAISEAAGICYEYGHSLMFVGWKEEKRLIDQSSRIIGQ